MKSKIKRLVAMTLCIVMLIGILPMNLQTIAHAAESQWLWPAKDCYIVSSNFGNRDLNGDGVYDDQHKGIDIIGASTTFGQPVMAAKSGFVYSYSNAYGDNEKVWTSDMTSFGNYVIIKHDDGTYTIYAHMRQSGIKTSGSVKQGDVIGYIGNSGASSGSHLHFQIFTNPSNLGSSSMNPMPTNSNITIRNPYSLPSNWAHQKQTYIFTPEATSYTITFNPNGGSCSTGSKTVTPGSAIGTLPTPTKSGYTFVGWYPSVNSLYEPVTSSTTVDENITLYAHWTSQPYSGNHIEFDAQGGTLGEYTQSVAVTAFNTGRAANTIVIFNCDGNLVETNYWGKEIAVDSNGRITAKRGYNVESQLTVPAGGFVLSMHNLGSDLFEAAEIGDFIGYSVVNGTTCAYLYKDEGAYVANHKYVSEGDAYGGFALPEREGYVFEGWFTSATGGTEVMWDSIYTTSELYAHWESLKYAQATSVLYDTDNNRIYELYDYIMSWEDAKAFCESRGGHLVTINSAEEQDLIVNGGLLNCYIRGSYAIGASDVEEEGNWKWVTGEEFNYSNWDQREPEPNGGTSENYCYLIAEDVAPNKTVGEWNDSKNIDYYNGFYDTCNTGFICEYENVCEHEYKTTVIDATCTEPGYITYECTACGDTKTESIEATGHNYQNGYCTKCDEKDPNVYIISYNANGGSGAPASQTKTHGITLTLSRTVPTRTGYTFLGWATSANASSATYASGASFTTNANTTLYAVWKANEYTISYNANGGSGAPASQTKTHGTTLTLSRTVPTRTGYTFLGWSTSANATSATYASGASFTSNANTTLYAVWKVNEYTISYNANGGTGAPASQTKTHGTTLTLSRTVPTRTGYTFLGWSTSANASSATYAAGARFTTNANTTLYAVWELNMLVPILGDVNTDGIITNADLIMMARYIVGLDDSDSVKQYGDINSDSQITNADLIALARIIVGLE